MSSTDQIITLFESLSFAEKLSLNERLATAMRKEGGGAATGKKRGPKAKADGEQKPKRKAALGTLAWMAYVKHIKATQPDDLDGLTKESEKLAIIKDIRARDPDGYNSFCAAWKEEHKDDASEAASVTSDAEAAEEEAAPVPAAAPKAQTPAEKIAAIKAAKAAAAPAPKAAAATPAKAAPKAAAAPGAPKKAVKAVKAAKAEPKKEGLEMPVLTLDDVEYWHDPSSNFLWLKTGDSTIDGMGEEVGYYQPENAEEPIRAAAFGDD